MEKTDRKKTIDYDDAKKAGRVLDDLIREAFTRHFGFDISEADNAQLLHMPMWNEGDPIHLLKYQHKPFFYFTDWETNFTYEKGKLMATFTMRYKFV